ncbi:MAG: 16S rRNA (adenine1518-N6/adenine1519-N6)-dimethyltransferase [archaeon GW2011_AR17]|nr:MAG: 16S rRNA (adenine1518-N6/adenine1519-N6)-dimethyltransferase [archaeon GW2011_AR17]MBS3153860.1 methyltransferase domain-containing protein [Candidatus Woesearchaeota archaeon]HIH15461.1 methyltransferase domain-containing protein [Nanoarchaeota archaeon]HIH59264.1 methyltransferase domain-containing protein [Nanoarchaeota archaeon]HII13941.1 methyltransferase domain-containing protein [Nanoarchaeota archaeon]
MLDQHFMIDEELLQRIVSAADLKKTDTILEIGSGTGNLTKLLVNKVKHVYVIEKDEKLLEELKKELKGENISFQNEDATQAKFPEFNKCVSNLPYTICEPLLWRFTRYKALCVFVVPHKFTEKLLGERPSRLKLLVDTFYNIEYLETIHPSAFSPQPKVQSALIKLTSKENNSFLREFLSQYDKKTKNALETILTKQGKTKSEAKNMIALKLRPKIQEQSILTLSLKEIEYIHKLFSNS